MVNHETPNKQENWRVPPTTPHGDQKRRIYSKAHTQRSKQHIKQLQSVLVIKYIKLQKIKTSVKDQNTKVLKYETSRHFQQVVVSEFFFKNFSTRVVKYYLCYHISGPLNLKLGFKPAFTTSNIFKKQNNQKQQQKTTQFDRIGQIHRSKIVTSLR